MEEITNFERRAFERLFLFRFPESFKRIGLLTMIILIIILFFLPDEGPTAVAMKEIVKNLLLFSLLMIALSKEKIEDERIASIRAKAFQVSFIWAIFYALLQPLASLLVSKFISVENGGSFIELGSFQVLFIMLLVQIGVFQLFKKDIE